MSKISGKFAVGIYKKIIIGPGLTHRKNGEYLKLYDIFTHQNLVSFLGLSEIIVSPEMQENEIHFIYK